MSEIVPTEKDFEHAREALRRDFSAETASVKLLKAMAIALATERARVMEVAVEELRDIESAIRISGKLTGDDTSEAMAVIHDCVSAIRRRLETP